MEIYETQPERTDLPLVVMPVIIESMIEPFEKNFELLKDIARVRMYKDFTLDEDTIVERCAEADAIMVIGFHCADSILDRLNAKCYAFGGTGVASYIDLDKAKERGIRVCNVVHYGDHAVAEHTIALLMELARQVGKLDRQVKTGDWDGADGYELYGKKLGIIGLGGIGQTVARIAGALGMNVSAWNSHVPEQVFADLNITPVNDMNELIAGSDVVSIHMPLLDSTKGIVTAENLEALKPGTMFINTARAEIIETGRIARQTPARRHSCGARCVRTRAAHCRRSALFDSRHHPHPAHRVAHRWRLCGHHQTGGPIRCGILQGRGFQRRRVNNRKTGMGKTCGRSA